jgi:glycosyltransferase involved in cell wall biosynthesis
MVVEASFLCELLDTLEGTSASIPYLGAWAGAVARRRGRRVVYTPFMLALCEKDWDALVSDAERQAFVAAYADLMPDATLLSPRLGLDVAASYRPVPATRRELHLQRLSERGRGVTPNASVTTPLPSYPEWLTRRIAQRAEQYRRPSQPLRFSMLSTVYEGTNVGLFQQTAGSLFSQGYPFFEWIVLAHGPISPALDGYLRELSANPRLNVLRRPVNLGIMGGMRMCLEAARGDYIVPMDADDLLTPDALQVFASVLRQKQEPAFIYSDEDILIDDIPAHPYWRPDWDPVLNLSSSYIWHLCAFRCDLAIKLGIYTDPGADWCHDWDSVFRFADAGHAPVHVPEVLYHWRQHRDSSTNRERPDTRSLDATRHVLEHRLGRFSWPERYELGLLRLFGDAREWRILRRRIAGPSVQAIIFATSRSGAQRARDHLDRAVSFRFADVRFCIGGQDSAAPRLPTAGEFADVLQSCDSSLVVVVSEAVRPAGDQWIWEACRLFECHADAALACGQIVNRDDTILAGAGVFDSHGRLRYPDVGQRLGDPGPFALGLKPHSVAAVPTDFFIGDARFLKSALDAVPRPAPLDHLGVRLGQRALMAGRRVVFSPAITAIAENDLVDRSRDHLLPPERACDDGAPPHLSSVRFLEAQQLYME